MTRVPASVIVILLIAGLSEALGRVLPAVARRRASSRAIVLGLLLTGAVVEGAALAMWPLVAWTLAELLLVHAPANGTAPGWTPGTAAPLMLAAILAFPLLGPLLHLLLFAGVGAALAGPLAAATGLGWWSAAGCVALAGFGLAGAIALIRRSVVALAVTS